MEPLLLPQVHFGGRKRLVRTCSRLPVSQVLMFKTTSITITNKRDWCMTWDDGLVVPMELFSWRRRITVLTKESYTYEILTSMCYIGALQTQQLRYQFGQLCSSSTKELPGCACPGFAISCPNLNLVCRGEVCHPWCRLILRTWIRTLHPDCSGCRMVPRPPETRLWKDNSFAIYRFNLHKHLQSICSNKRAT